MLETLETMHKCDITGPDIPCSVRVIMGLDQNVTYRAIVFQTKPTIQNHPQYPCTKSGFLMYLLVQFCIKASCAQIGACLV